MAMHSASARRHRVAIDVGVQFELDDGPFGNPEPVAVLMPGESYLYTKPWTRSLGLARLGATLVFRDAAGVHWQTNDRGELAEQCSKVGLVKELWRYELNHDGRHSWERELSPTRTSDPAERPRTASPAPGPPAGASQSEAVREPSGLPVTTRAPARSRTLGR